MPIYVFENMQTGEIIETLMRHDQACAIGEWMDVLGAPCRRLPSAPALARPSSDGGAFKLVSNALPLKHQLEKMTDARGNPLRAPAYDEKGRAVFSSAAEVREFCKLAGGKYVWSKDYDGPTTTDERIAEEKQIARSMDERNQELNMFRAADAVPGATHDQAVAEAAQGKKDGWYKDD